MWLEEILMHLYSKYLLRAFHEPDTILYTYHCLLGVYILLRRHRKQMKEIDKAQYVG